ncbi:MAG TPA: AsmA family protein [Terriglobales bacterium]|nr:AsmA family protein [Terriglobales bacterium]
MRKIAIVIGIVVLVIVVAVGVLFATFDPNDYRGTIQTKLEQQLNRNVTLGNMSLGLFPLRFRVANLSIADDPKFSNRAFLLTQELSVSVKLLPLLSKSVEVDSLTLERPSVELIKNAQGVWNFASLGEKTPAPAPAAPYTPAGPARPPAPAATAASNGQQFSLGELAIKDGLVAITDLQDRKPRTVYDHINFKLTDFSPDTPFNLDASVHLPGSGSQEVQLKGTGGPLSHANPASTPFKGSLDLKGVEIGELQKFLQSPALVNTDGVLSGHTDIASASGKLSANGQMNLDKPKLHGIDVGYPINVDYDVSDDLVNDLLTINKGAIKLGPTPVSVTGTMNSKPTPAQVDLELKASNVSIAEIARLSAAAGVAFAPGTTVNGQINADIKAQGAMDKPALNGSLAGNNIQISGKEIAKPVQVKTVNITLTPTEIHSDNFNVTSGGTTAAVQFSMKQYTSNSPQVNATVRAPQAALPDLLSMAKAYGVTSLDKVSGAGNLALDMSAAGPLQSISSDQITKTLNGTINVNFNNVRYAGVDISHQLLSMIGSSQSGKDQGYTNVQKMTGSIVVKNGVAQTNNLQATLDIGNVGATGTANLASQTLNMQLTAVLSKAFTQQAGGTGVAGFMTTALANNQGELVIPAIVTGTFQNPKVVPDVQKMAQMKLKGLIPNGDNPLGAASSILGGLTGQKGQPAAGQQQNPASQIMGLFGNKKKQ